MIAKESYSTYACTRLWHIDWRPFINSVWEVINGCNPSRCEIDRLRTEERCAGAKHNQVYVVLKVLACRQSWSKSDIKDRGTPVKILEV